MDIAKRRSEFRGQGLINVKQLFAPIRGRRNRGVVTMIWIGGIRVRNDVVAAVGRVRQRYKICFQDRQSVLIHADIRGRPVNLLTLQIVDRLETRGIATQRRTIRKVLATETKRGGSPEQRANVAEIEDL